MNVDEYLFCLVSGAPAPPIRVGIACCGSVICSVLTGGYVAAGRIGLATPAMGKVDWKHVLGILH
jgi:hypothetical protein